MPAQNSPLLDSESDGILEAALHRWQSLDRGWKAGVLGVAIVLHHLPGIVP